MTLVGAGPGDPELLTLSAVRALQSADVILFDDLVVAEVLEFARREAKKMLVGKTGYGPSCKQDDINALMVSLAKSGQRVVRLKGGDPDDLRPRRRGDRGLPRGRHRGRGRARHHRGAGRGEPPRRVADPPRLRAAPAVRHRPRSPTASCPPTSTGRASPTRRATTIVYMPKKTLAELTTHAIAEGLDPATPAIAVASATRPTEIAVAAPVAQIADRLGEADIKGPVLVLIGRALDSAMALANETGQTSGGALAS